MRKVLVWILIVLLLFGVAGLFVYRYRSDRVQLNSGYVNGNTPGNLYNGGLFCESDDGIVYFANPDDRERLYCMDSDGSNVKKLSNDTVTYINVDSNYVYYVRNNDNSSLDYSFFSFHNNSLCRIDRDGGRVVVLDTDPCLYASLIGNYIYYLHYDTQTATTLYKIKIDGTEKTKLSNTYLFTCSSDGQYFYYNDTTTDGSIWVYDTSSDSTHQVYACNSYKPVVSTDGNAYYLDVNQDNALVHTNINTGTPTTLTTDSIDTYNVYGNTIYYQKYDEDQPGICMIKNDGSGARELLSGTYSTISVTKYYIYVTDYRTGQVFYTSTSTPGNFAAFHPGVEE
jgi:uncharacterized protein YxeA